MTLSPRIASIVSLFLSGILATASVFILTGTLPNIDTNIGWILSVFALITVASALFSLSVARGRSRTTSRLRISAAQHGFDFIRHLDGPGFQGLLFREGTKVHAHDLVDARKSSTPFLAGALVGQYANDSSTPRVVASSFIMIPLPKSVPNIVLIAKGLGTLRQAGLSLVGRQKLSLEGDFDSNFTLYCPEGYERDALYIFAPDLMNLLIETTAGCDVEFVDDVMYVYSAPGRYRDGAAIDNLVKVAERVQDKLARQTSKYADDRAVPLAGAPSKFSAATETIAAPRTVSPEDHAAQAGKVGAEGQRLRTKTTVLQKLTTIGTTLLLAAGVVVALFHYLPLWLSR